MANPPFRQATRSSFAFNTAQPVETHATLNPGFRGGAVQGGESRGEVVRATPFTLPTDDGIPDFLLKSVEPYIREKQTEAMFKGMTDAAAGKTLKDIDKGDSGIGQIFGPSYYHQGAAAFTATAALENLKAEVAKDPTVEQMDSGQLSQYLAGKYKGLMTGDSVADPVLQQSIMQMHGPLVQQLTARREAYVQRQALLGWSNTADGKAGNLQSTLTDPALDGPSGNEAKATSLRDYVSHVLNRPVNMTVEAHQGAVVNSARAALSKGNFYAFEALKANGLDNLLGDEQAARMETAYHSAAQRAFARVSSDPAVNDQLAAMDLAIKGGKVTSDAQLREWANKVNTVAAKVTGIQSEQLITGDDLLAMQKDLNEHQFQGYLRVQEHQFQLRKMELDHQLSLEEDEAKQAQKYKLAGIAASTGNASLALSQGGADSQSINRVFSEAVAGGRFDVLAKNFIQSQYVNDAAANELQSPVAASIGVGLTEGFKGAYSRWQQLYAANPAAAASYYGKYGADMEAYHRLIKGGEQPLAAYAQSFGRPPDQGHLDLPQGTKPEEAYKAVADVIAKEDAGWFSSGRTPLASSSSGLITEYLVHEAGAYAQRAGIPLEAAAERVKGRLFSSGVLERAGPFAWNNQHSTRPLQDYLGLPAEHVDKLVTQVADAKLRAAGFDNGASGDNYETMRYTGPDGRPALYIMAYPSDGSQHVDAVIHLSDLQAANMKSLSDTQRSATKRRKDISDFARRHSLLTQ